MPPQHIAVLGGGLTGLSSAFHLARRFPKARISLLEKQNRLGGWVMSERVDLDVPSADGTRQTAHVLLEGGPRTLRPTGLAVLELVHLLNLTPSLLTVPRTAPAARNRFLHLPERGPGLVKIPASLPSLFTSPLARTLLPAVLRDALSPAHRPPPAAADEDGDGADESVDAFLTRRFGAPFARTFGSALVHGIYAADARRLSVRAAFPQLLEYAARGRGSVVRGVLASALARKPPAGEGAGYALGEVARRMEGVSVYSFRDGMGELVRALERDLLSRPNVEILRGDGATSLRSADGERGLAFEVRTASGTTLAPSHLVSALPLPALHALLPPRAAAAAALPHLAAEPAASVTVVNLVFPGPPAALLPPGFGYLVPRAAPPHAYADPLGVLGTVFDACALPAQDAGAPTTKLTMMLGGPYPAPAPSDAAFVSALLDTLAHHLGRPRAHLPAPLLVRARTHAECIPTPTPGHAARVAELQRAVRARWGGRVEVVGAGVGGVSVPACVEAGRGVGRDW